MSNIIQKHGVFKQNKKSKFLLKKPSNNFIKKLINTKEKKLSVNFSPKDKMKYNISSPPNKEKGYKNSLLSLDKKNTKYMEYLNKNNSSKFPNQRNNKIKDKIVVNQSLENAFNNNSISINSIIRDENNSLHNSVERVPIANTTNTSSKSKKNEPLKSKILVLDYKDNDGSRNKKNQNINNILTHNHSINLSKIMNTTNVRKKLLKENSRNVLNNNFINKVTIKKEDSSVHNIGSFEGGKVKNPFSKYSSNSKFLMFRTKYLENTNNLSISKTTNNNLQTESNLISTFNDIPLESLNNTIQTTVVSKAMSNDKKHAKNTLSNDNIIKKFNAISYNYSLETSKKNTIDVKEEKRDKAKLLPKQIKEIPKEISLSTSNKNTVIKKKTSNSLTSNNEIFLKSNSGFQKTKSINESKKLANTSLSKPKQEATMDYFTPKEIIDKFSKYLNPFEQEEIFFFHEIYYCGKFLKNKQQMIKIESNSNLGSSLVRNNTSTNEEDKNININEIYKDDEQGNFTFKKGDQIYYRYEILNELGRGSFGIALKCFDHKNKEFCCVKVVKNKKKVLDQAKIEIRILEFIKNKDNNDEAHVVKIIDNFTFRNHICIVFELLDMNLYELIKNLDFQGIDLKQVRRISAQILETLIFLKRQRIIHCDLKPENILIRNFSKAKINVIDFGSSCFENEKLYSYLQSRFYRAPEVILGTGYGIEIDMWSFGCIIAELYSGIPIFPGESSVDQINYIMEYLGIPPLEIINAARKKLMFFDENGEPLKIPNSKGKIRQPLTKKFEKFLSDSSDEFIDLVKNCLVWDPRKRIKPHEALLHPFFTNDAHLQLEINNNTIKKVEKKSTIIKTEEDKEKKLNNSNIGKIKEINFCEKSMIPKKVNLKLNLDEVSNSKKIRIIEILQDEKKNLSKKNDKSKDDNFLVNSLNL